MGSMDITELLTQSVTEVIDKDHLTTRLKKGDKLIVKLGIDPTTPNLHLGHAVVLKKLAQFQKAGHKAVLVIGDFTALVGDPSGRDTQRPILTNAEIEKNWSDYKNQAGKLFDFDHAEVVRNSSWFKNMDLSKMFELTSKATINQIVERKEFQNRLKEKSHITYLEMLYPLLQAYDSVMLKADLELGGTDQKFNLLMGRQIQKRFGQNEQDILMTPLLVGLDGKNKMSKSLGNYIALTEEPEVMYAKVMSIPDTLTDTYFELVTNLNSSEINQEMKKGPFEAKKSLAYSIVSLYHDPAQADQAEVEFVSVFSEKNLPATLPVVKLGREKRTMASLASVTFGLSMSESRRLIDQKAFSLDGKTVLKADEIVEPVEGNVLKLGKHRFAKIETNE